MKKNIRDKIIKKTIEIVAKKGVNGASIMDIAKAAKITPSVIYYYFKNKHDLIYAAILSVAHKVGGRINLVLEPQLSFHENYKNAMREVVLFIRENPDEAYFYGQLPFFPKGTLSEHEYLSISEYCPMARLLNSGIRQGCIQSLSNIILIGYYPVYSYVLNTPKELDEDERIIESMWQAICTAA